MLLFFDLKMVTWVGKIPGERKGYSLQYSGLENSMDCIVYGVAKSLTWLSDFHFSPLKDKDNIVGYKVCFSLDWNDVRIEFSSLSLESVWLEGLENLDGTNILKKKKTFEIILDSCMRAQFCLFAIPWTAACQAPLFMGLFRQYWSGLSFPSPDTNILLTEENHTV